MDFNKDVLEQSFNQPVVVDFWAPWCEPCRVLGPVIEKLAEEQTGRWALVKVNTEDYPSVAQAYRVMSIPNVKMFYQGDMIAEFAGALSKTAIEKWLDEHIPDDQKDDLHEMLAKEGEVPDAQLIEQLEKYVLQNPEYKDANVTLAKHLVFSKPEEVDGLLKDIHLGEEWHEMAEDIKTIVRFLNYAGTEETPVAKAIRKAQEATRILDFEEAIQKVIQAVTADKSFQKDLPRKTAIAFFHILGNGHELTKNHRWRFDMALY